MAVESVEAYYNLANTVIKLAASDYRSYRKKVNRDWGKMEDYEKRVYTSKISELEKFFISPYGMFLSRGLGDVILEKLQKEFEED